MSISKLVGSVGMLCLLGAWGGGSGMAQTVQPWQKLYTGADATGPEVLGLWQFQPGAELKDSSGKNLDLVLRGEGRVVAQGPLGGALESFPADADNDKPQGAHVPNNAALNPTGAFTVEAWIAAKPEMDRYGTVSVVDKKYFYYARDLAEANTGYAIYLSRTGEHKRRVMVTLGYGADSDFISGPEISLPPGEWVHLAYTYDGEGRSRIFVNGDQVYKIQMPGRGAVAPGPHNLTLGDRVGSVYHGFPGYLAQVRLCQGIVPTFTGGLMASSRGSRSVFRRLEKNAQIQVKIENETLQDLPAGEVAVTLAGQKRQYSLPALASSQAEVITLDVDTALRPGEYMAQVDVVAGSGAAAVQATHEVPITIVNRPLPHRMPVVMWGGGDIPRLKAMGFTHQLIHLVDYEQVWKAGQPGPAMSLSSIEANGQMLDELLKNDLYGAVYPYPGTMILTDKERLEKFNRVDRNGQTSPHANVCGNFPEVQEYCYNVGASIAQTFGHYPALDGSLIHSEVRDGTSLCFHEHDRQLYREATGLEIPEEALGKGGVRYSRIADFPANRVIKDDDSLLTYYRWFWKSGDGWNPLHSLVNKGLKSTGRHDLWTFYDPAVRVPGVWGSGGEVDIVSQWTYSYPDPIKIGQATDELFAMAEGQAGQQVMKMTQIIWYRRDTAPKLPADEADWVGWEKEKPEAPFISISPDHMREAFWSKISRPVRGIMYHGWGSLVETGTTDKGYVFTNPRTAEVLTELTHKVVQPLGPTLLQVPDRPTDVAVLESFASQMYAGRGSYGWSNSWEADMHLILQWAHLQPRVVFDESVLRDGLDAYKVLVMPFCDVLTEGVVDKIRAFQNRGGIVVGDDYLCPAILPDIIIPVYKRTGQADKDKEALQAKAAELRGELDPFYSRLGDSSEADLVLRWRQYRDSDYLFALNDRRTYGDYVGHHGLVMEQGLPLSGTITVARPGATVYDLVRHRAVRTRATDQGVAFDVSYEPGGGALYLLTSQPIAAVRLQAPAEARRGRALAVRASVVDRQGQALSAVVPVHLEILDPAGNLAEFSGYYGAKDGQLQVGLNLASNDLPGNWTIKVTELASGRRQQQQVVVR